MSDLTANTVDSVVRPNSRVPVTPPPHTTTNTPPLPTEPTFISDSFNKTDKINLPKFNFNTSQKPTLEIPKIISPLVTGYTLGFLLGQTYRRYKDKDKDTGSILDNKDDTFKIPGFDQTPRRAPESTQEKKQEVPGPQCVPNTQEPNNRRDDYSLPSEQSYPIKLSHTAPFRLIQSDDFSQIETLSVTVKKIKDLLNQPQEDKKQCQVIIDALLKQDPQHAALIVWKSLKDVLSISEGLVKNLNRLMRGCIEFLDQTPAVILLKNAMHTKDPFLQTMFLRVFLSTDVDKDQPDLFQTPFEALLALVPAEERVALVKDYIKTIFPRNGESTNLHGGLSYIRLVFTDANFNLSQFIKITALIPSQDYAELALDLLQRVRIYSIKSMHRSSDPTLDKVRDFFLYRLIEDAPEYVRDMLLRELLKYTQSTHALERTDLVLFMFLEKSLFSSAVGFKIKKKVIEQLVISLALMRSGRTADALDKTSIDIFMNQFFKWSKKEEIEEIFLNLLNHLQLKEIPLAFLFSFEQHISRINLIALIACSTNTHRELFILYLKSGLSLLDPFFWDLFLKILDGQQNQESIKQRVSFFLLRIESMIKEYKNGKLLNEKSTTEEKHAAFSAIDVLYSLRLSVPLSFDEFIKHIKTYEQRYRQIAERRPPAFLPSSKQTVPVPEKETLRIDSDISGLMIATFSQWLVLAKKEKSSTQRVNNTYFVEYDFLDDAIKQLPFNLQTQLKISIFSITPKARINTHQLRDQIVQFYQNKSLPEKVHHFLVALLMLELTVSLSDLDRYKYAHLITETILVLTRTEIRHHQVSPAEQDSFASALLFMSELLATHLTPFINQDPVWKNFFDRYPKLHQLVHELQSFSRNHISIKPSQERQLIRFDSTQSMTQQIFGSARNQDCTHQGSLCYPLFQPIAIISEQQGQEQKQVGDLYVQVRFNKAGQRFLVVAIQPSPKSNLDRQVLVKASLNYIASHFYKSNYDAVLIPQDPFFQSNDSHIQQHLFDWVKPILDEPLYLTPEDNHSILGGQPIGNAIQGPVIFRVMMLKPNVTLKPDKKN